LLLLPASWERWRGLKEMGEVVKELALVVLHGLGLFRRLISTYMKNKSDEGSQSCHGREQ